MLTLERKWDNRVEQWHSHVTSAAAFERVLRDLIQIAAPRPADSCVDLGAGTGFVTMALAPQTSSVLAVDISGAMASALAERAAADGLGHVATQVADLRDFRLRLASADLVVSSYALHHLVDAGKRALVARAARWLHPGGRLVMGDMMFGRGTSARDRAILRQKVTALAAKGPGGWWRIAKSLTRRGLGVGQGSITTPAASTTSTGLDHHPAPGGEHRPAGKHVPDGEGGAEVDVQAPGRRVVDAVAGRAPLARPADTGRR